MLGKITFFILRTKFPLRKFYARFFGDQIHHHFLQSWYGRLLSISEIQKKNGVIYFSIRTICIHPKTHVIDETEKQNNQPIVCV